MKRIVLATLFERRDGITMGYSRRAAALHDREVELSGFLAPTHDGSDHVMLVSQPGICPDCAAEPVAAIQLPGFAVKGLPTVLPVRLRGRIDFGFALDAGGHASFLRLRDARIATGLPT